MKIKEEILHHIWKHQYFNRFQMISEKGGEVEVISPGRYNVHQGPDFLEARIRIGGILLIGNVEIHVRASDWVKHAHDNDPNYMNVILHVVWENDHPGILPDIPCFELKNRIPLSVMKKFESLLEQGGNIPCRAQLKSVPEAVWENWKEELLIRRLNNRARQIKSLLLKNNFHWEETFWWLIARGFGYSANAVAFESIAQSIPFATLLRHRSVLVQIEALLLGQAGLLNKRFKDEYPQMLQKEYQFYRKKYNLPQNVTQVHFLRMRPVNFPTVRLSQLSVLFHENINLFQTIKDENDLQKVEKLFLVTANDYWHYHYNLDDTSLFKPKTLGKTMISLLIINAVIPFLYTYGIVNQHQEAIDKSLKWIKKQPAERNSILLQFNEMGVFASNAAESQALIELKTEFCDQLKCLDCAIGKSILNIEAFESVP